MLSIVLLVLLELEVGFLLKINFFTTNQTDLNDANNVSFERESIV
jgi:hypothetical protein